MTLFMLLQTFHLELNSTLKFTRLSSHVNHTSTWTQLQSVNHKIQEENFMKNQRLVECKLRINVWLPKKLTSWNNYSKRTQDLQERLKTCSQENHTLRKQPLIERFKTHPSQTPLLKKTPLLNFQKPARMRYPWLISHDLKDLPKLS